MKAVRTRKFVSGSKARAPVPDVRVQVVLQDPVRENGDYVLYWMIASRRPYWNFGLQRAVEWARQLKKPLVILEALDCGYEWMTDRTHRFIMQGMEDNLQAFARKSVYYYPYVARTRKASRGFLSAVAAKACAVVADRFPAYICPGLIDAAARRLHVRFEAVDSCGVLPLDATDRVFQRAFSFRNYLHKTMAEHSVAFPLKDPLAGVRLPRFAGLDKSIVRRWPSGIVRDLRRIDVDHSVPPVREQGGWCTAMKVFSEFQRSPRVRRSGLSPYLHYGHISAHEVYEAARTKTEFIDELLTWRELGFNMCAHRKDFDDYESLPEWAQRTLAKHAGDPRNPLYTPRQLERSKTHDPVWNEAQRQLVEEGTIDPYLRMLWGKKILEWTKTPQQALSVMIDLNNKYAVDGRDPNSYNGIMWVLGRYDRPWGPERNIFGTVRYMSSESTARKMRSREYASRYGRGAKGSARPGAR